MKFFIKNILKGVHMNSKEEEAKIPPPQPTPPPSRTQQCLRPKWQKTQGWAPTGPPVSDLTGGLPPLGAAPGLLLASPGSCSLGSPALGAVPCPLGLCPLALQPVSQCCLQTRRRTGTAEPTIREERGSQQRLSLGKPHRCSKPPSVQS